jgi:transposase-like protein
MAESGSQGGIVIWPSEATAARTYDIANIALIAALVLGVVATALIVWMGNVKEEYLKRDLAKVTNETAKAQLETQRLKEQLAWREISSEQETKFLAAISGSPPPGLKVSMMVVAGDAEGAQYAEDVAKLLRKTGLSVDPPSAAMFVRILPEGVIIKIREQNSLGGTAGLVLQQAFKAAGIDAPGVLVPSMTSESIEILVGIKPHPRAGK